MKKKSIAISREGEEVKKGMERIRALKKRKKLCFAREERERRKTGSVRKTEKYKTIRQRIRSEIIRRKVIEEGGKYRKKGRK